MILAERVDLSGPIPPLNPGWVASRPGGGDAGRSEAECGEPSEWEFSIVVLSRWEMYSKVVAMGEGGDHGPNLFKFFHVLNYVTRRTFSERDSEFSQPGA